MPEALFPNGARIQRLRIARPTDQLEAVTRFYRDGLGLPVIGQFEDHDGYDGVMLGLPDVGVHLEFTRHRLGSPGAAPSQDNLLVLYAQGGSDLKRFEDSFARIGALPVKPENPYWQGKSLTFQDPDGWRVVIFDLSVLH